MCFAFMVECVLEKVNRRAQGTPAQSQLTAGSTSALTLYIVKAWPTPWTKCF